jgi:hypothetical protein
MPFATLDGIKTHCRKQGSGPCLPMIAPRGFESTLQSWEHGKWQGYECAARLSDQWSGYIDALANGRGWSRPFAAWPAKQ